MATRSGQRTLFNIALVLAVIGALNWGLVGLFNWNLVDALLGGGAREETSALSRALYVIVGLAGVVVAVLAGSRRTALGEGSRTRAPG
jgi:uncharacterized membrane protein YuzA (DUF378 family)